MASKGEQGEVSEGYDYVRLTHLDLCQEFGVTFRYLGEDVLAVKLHMGKGDLILLCGKKGG